MPIDDLKYNAPATKGELAGVVITTTLALEAVLDALLAIKNAKEVDASVTDIKFAIGQLDKSFDALTGWTSDGS